MPFFWYFFGQTRKITIRVECIFAKIKQFTLFFFLVKNTFKMKKQNTRSNVPPEARRTVTLVRSRAMFRRVTLCCWDAQVERKLHCILISRLKNAKRQGNLAHLPDLVQRDADRQKWDGHNTHGVVVIIVHDPQGDAETLEHVEGVQNLRIKKKKRLRLRMKDTNVDEELFSQFTSSKRSCM